MNRRLALVAFLSAVTLGGMAHAEPSQRGCADHWTIALDRQSFVHNGAGRKFSAAQLSAFRKKVDAQIKSAISAACKKGRISLAAAKAVRRVQVSSASGATEPALFPAPDGSLTFEWIFAEQFLAVPRASEIVAGAACWTDPRSGACFAPGD